MEGVVAAVAVVAAVVVGKVVGTVVRVVGVGVVEDVGDVVGCYVVIESV